jgi:hypothetical protein
MKEIRERNEAIGKARERARPVLRGDLEPLEERIAALEAALKINGKPKKGFLPFGKGS